MNVNQIIRNTISTEKNPLVSIITPVYNRADIIDRTFSSVLKLNFKDFEYIVVDDGSTDNIDDVVNSFMNNAPFSVTFIKKDNGGVHTARNIGVKYAKGKFIYFLDSDDETLPNAINVFLNEWEKIKNVDEYYEIKGRTILENGEIMGNPFPDNVNSLSQKQISYLKKTVKGELVGFRPASILKTNPWPEPEGITFVLENILWDRLNKRYKSWLINEPVQLYHYSTVSIVRTQKRNRQSVLNQLWNAVYMLNDKKVYRLGLSYRLKTLVRVNVYKKILKGDSRIMTLKLSNFNDLLFSFLLEPFSFFVFLRYRKNRFLDD